MSKKFAALTSSISFLLLSGVVHAQGLIDSGTGFVPAGSSGQGDISKVTSTVVQILFIAAAVLAAVFLILGGIRWITSRGDKAGVEAARKQIVAAIIGLIVVAGAFLVLNVVFTVLHVSNPLQGGTFDLPHL